jgi:hypothetical protein
MVTAAEYKAEKDKNRQLVAENAKLLEQNTAMSRIIEAFEKRIKALEDQKETQAANRDYPWLNAVNGGKKSEDRLNLLNVVSDENKERNKKEKNVIVFGLKESTKASVTEKKEEDTNEINQILQQLSLENVTVDGTFRLKTKNTNKPKPLIIVLKDKETRNKVLYAAKVLKNSVNHKEVFLCPDLTDAQRLKYKALVKLRDEKNEKLQGEEKGNKIFVIRDNEVVPVKRRN